MMKKIKKQYNQYNKIFIKKQLSKVAKFNNNINKSNRKKLQLIKTRKLNNKVSKIIL